MLSFRSAVLGALLFIMLSASMLSAAIAVAPSPVAAASASSPSTSQGEHPRQEATRTIFANLIAALKDDYPVLEKATLHFVDVNVANAWVNQDAEVYVTTGLMDLLKTDDQMAGVLGHELAHVTESHAPEQIERYWQWTLLSLGLAIAGDRYDPVDRSTLRVLQPLVLFAYSREDELEADQVGIQHVEKAGYDPHGLVEALQLIARQTSRTPAHELWMTHPLPETRLVELRRLIDPRLGIPTTDGARLQRGVAGSYADPEEAAIDFIYSTWEEPEILESLVAPGTALPAPLERDAVGTDNYLYPLDWLQARSAASPRVVLESNETHFLDRRLRGHLELTMPSGTVRGPGLELIIGPTARGWQIKSVNILPE